MHTFLIPQEQIQGSSEQDAGPQGGQLQAIVGEAIANLNAQLDKMAQEPQPEEKQSPQGNIAAVGLS